MDTDVIHKQYNQIADFYPDLNITQLGLTMLVLGSLRASMGHEDAEATLRDYINKKHLTAKDEITQRLKNMEMDVDLISKTVAIALENNMIRDLKTNDPISFIDHNMYRVVNEALIKHQDQLWRIKE